MSPAERKKFFNDTQLGTEVAPINDQRKPVFSSRAADRVVSYVIGDTRFVERSPVPPAFGGDYNQVLDEQDAFLKAS